MRYLNDAEVAAVVSTKLCHFKSFRLGTKMPNIDTQLCLVSQYNLQRDLQSFGDNTFCKAAPLESGMNSNI